MSDVTFGVSDSAQFIDEMSSKGQDRFRKTEVFGLDSALREELASVWAECRFPNWDGYSAQPVSQESLRATYELLEQLPEDLPAPSVGADPDGQLTLEWYKSPRKTLSVSIGPFGELCYAALIGPRRSYGTEIADRGWPAPIIDLARRVVD